MEAMQLHDAATADYNIRNKNRKGTLAAATMALVIHFMGLGDDQVTANDKVDQISDVLLDTVPGAVTGYSMGCARQKTKLIDAINGIDEVAFPFFDAAAKLVIVNKLNLVT